MPSDRCARSGAILLSAASAAAGGHYEKQAKWESLHHRFSTPGTILAIPGPLIDFMKLKGLG
jgi:hypothetical protein